MTEQDCKSCVQKLKDDYELNKKKLMWEFAVSNSPYKIGCIIKDHIGSGIILKIKAEYSYYPNLPKCVYYCDNLTKTGTINKREPHRYIYQSNIKE